jgi:uncharacterized membrane protein YhaH (DUF805 family)
MDIDWAYLFTSLQGRIDRVKFWVGIVAIGIVQIIVQFLIGSIAGIVLAAIVSLVLLYPMYAVVIKRANDRDRPQWWAGAAIAIIALNTILTPFVGATSEGGKPFILTLLTGLSLLAGLWMLIDLGCLPGTPGSNQYGADPVAGQPAAGT